MVQMCSAHLRQAKIMGSNFHSFSNIHQVHPHMKYIIVGTLHRTENIRATPINFTKPRRRQLPRNLSIRESTENYNYNDVTLKEDGGLPEVISRRFCIALQFTAQTEKPTEYATHAHAIRFTLIYFRVLCLQQAMYRVSQIK